MTKAQERIRVFILDDHTMLRSGLKALLDAESDIEVIGDAGEGAGALELVCEEKPDIVLVDITMPGMSGIEFTRELRKCCPEAKVVGLTMHEDESYLRQLFAAGASGYIVKQAADAELTEAIRSVHAGNIYVHPSMIHALVEDIREAPPRSATGHRPLTDRETEVLKLVAQGYTNRQVADRLFISVKTVEAHRANIMDKLNLKGRAELVRYALDMGLLELS